jgi:HD-like signal output (HDOD) protein
MGAMAYSREWQLFQHEQRLDLERELEQFLLDEGRYDCFPSLNYILAELAGNAEKANLKRAHFAMAGLDPHDEAQYERGMTSFRNAVNSKAEDLINMVKERGSQVKVWFGKDGDDLVFGVFNNAPLLPREALRFREKLGMAAQFRSVQDVLRSEPDHSEGGGLGLIITVLMLRKIGLDESFLRLGVDDDGTTTRIIMPPRAGKEEELVAEAAAQAIGHIPQFPEHVLEILRILDDPAKSFADIAPIVSQDSNLIAELLKTANASVYGLPRTVQTIEQAVAVLGLPALQDLLIAVIAERLLIDEFSLPAVRTITTRAIEVSWYCRELVKKAKMGRVSSGVFLGAMLRNFGELIVNSLFPELTDKLAALCRQRGWNPFYAEVLTNGLNHSLVGAELAKRWKFPEVVVEVIRFHHIPLEAGRAYRDAVCVVYLGDFLWSMARAEAEWDDIEPGVLEQLKHQSPEEWRVILEDLLQKHQE